MAPRLSLSTGFREKLLLLSLAMLAMTSGCQSGGRSKEDRGISVSQQPSAMITTQLAASQPAFDLTRYCRANRLGRWVYRRIQTSDPDKPESEYIRRATPAHLYEGTLHNHQLEPIERYLVHEDRQDSDQRPYASLGDGYAMFLELADAIAPIAPVSEKDQVVDDTTYLRWYDWLGRPGSAGRLSRQVAIEGQETVAVPAGKFEDCLRVKISLKVSFILGPSVTWSSRVWLSPTAGEVKRVEWFTGWFIVIPFGSAYVYELTEYHNVSDPPADLNLFPRWKYSAVLFDRGLRQPRLAGMVVDFEQATTEGQNE